MSSRSVFCAVCLVGALAAVACGNDDDGNPQGQAGSSGRGNAGNSGRGNAGNSGRSGGGDAGLGEAGGSAGTDGGAGGEGGEGGQPPIVVGCTQLSDFVHTVIKDDTNATSSPRPVNGVVFCDDPADPAAYDDLF